MFYHRFQLFPREAFKVSWKLAIGQQPLSHIPIHLSLSLVPRLGTATLLEFCSTTGIALLTWQRLKSRLLVHMSALWWKSVQYVNKTQNIAINVWKYVSIVSFSLISKIITIKITFKNANLPYFTQIFKL